MNGDLYITNGTSRINLLTGIDGYHLDEWNPALPGRESTWRDSPLSDGRKPALMKWSNATETMKFKIAHFTQDDVIYETQELRRLLLAAEEYFFGVNNVPVWIEARGTCETNTRYAVVVTWAYWRNTFYRPDTPKPTKKHWYWLPTRRRHQTIHWLPKASTGGPGCLSWKTA